MAIKTERYIRKPLFVDAVRVNGKNFHELANWCDGEIMTDEDSGDKFYIKVRVQTPKSDRQTKAFVGDWILYTDRGYKVYTQKAFRNAFDPYTEPKSNPAEAELAQEHVTPAQVQEWADRDIAAEVKAELTPALQEQVGPSEEPVSSDSIELASDEVLEEGKDFFEGELPKYPEPELVPATPEGIAQAATENDALKLNEVGKTVEEIADILDLSVEEVTAILQPSSTQPTEKTVEDVEEQEKVVPAAVEGRRVLSVQEQETMTPEEIREALQEKDVVLAQDIA